MAKKKVDVIEDVDIDDAVEEDLDDVDPDDDEISADVPDLDDDLDVDADDDDDDDAVVSDDDEEAEALDELEAEELEMLTDDEAAEVIPVDEAAALRDLRREALSLGAEPPEARSDEFVCQSCFLVKRVSQLADKKHKYCRDCAA